MVTLLYPDHVISYSRVFVRSKVYVESPPKTDWLHHHADSPVDQSKYQHASASSIVNGSISLQCFIPNSVLNVNFKHKIMIDQKCVSKVN